MSSSPSPCRCPPPPSYLKEDCSAFSPARTPTPSPEMCHDEVDPPYLFGLGSLLVLSAAPRLWPDTDGRGNTRRRSNVNVTWVTRSNIIPNSLSIYIHIHIHIYIYIYVYIYISIYLSTYLSIYLSVSLCVCVYKGVLALKGLGLKPNFASTPLPRLDRSLASRISNLHGCAQPLRLRGSDGSRLVVLKVPCSY